MIIQNPTNHGTGLSADTFLSDIGTIIALISTNIDTELC